MIRTRRSLTSGCPAWRVRRFDVTQPGPAHAKRRTGTGWLAILGVFAGLTCVTTPAGAAPAADETLVVQRAAVPGTDRQLGMGVAVFPANAEKSWHQATGPELIYVMAGSLTVQIEDKAPALLHTGDSFCIPANVRHLTTAGPDGAKVLASWVWIPGRAFNIATPP